MITKKVVVERVCDCCKQKFEHLPWSISIAAYQKKTRPEPAEQLPSQGDCMGSAQAQLCKQCMGKALRLLRDVEFESRNGSVPQPFPELDRMREWLKL